MCKGTRPQRVLIHCLECVYQERIGIHRSIRRIMRPSASLVPSDGWFWLSINCIALAHTHTHELNSEPHTATTAKLLMASRNSVHSRQLRFVSSVPQWNECEKLKSKRIKGQRTYWKRKNNICYVHKRIVSIDARLMPSCSTFRSLSFTFSAIFCSIAGAADRGPSAVPGADWLLSASSTGQSILYPPAMLFLL